MRMTSENFIVKKLLSDFPRVNIFSINIRNLSGQYFSFKMNLSIGSLCSINSLKLVQF